MQVILETHKFAPELNKALLGKNRVPVNASGVNLIADYRKRNRPLPAFIFATVSSVYDNPDYKWLQRTYAGKVQTRQEALEFARQVRTTQLQSEHAKGRVIVRTKLVGG